MFGRAAAKPPFFFGIRVHRGKLNVATMCCDDVRHAVYFFLDGSLDEPAQLDYTTHIKHCPECETRTKVQRRIRVFIVNRLRPECAPERLKQRLLRTFRAMNAEWA